MAQVNMSLRIDAELKDAFMAAAKSMDRNGSQLIPDLSWSRPFCFMDQEKTICSSVMVLF